MADKNLIPYLHVLFRFQEERPAVPTDAERLTASQFVEATHAPSKFVPGLMVEGDPVFHCPKCHAHHREIEHGQRVQCSECRLYMEQYGDGLTIWMQKE